MQIRSLNGRRAVAADLRASTIDGCCYSGMVGLGETYFAALYLAAGFAATQAAWLAALPIFAGSLFQLVTPRAVARIGSWKRWTVLNASLQSFSLFLMAALMASGQASFLAAFLIAGIYYGSGQATAPTWNMWIERVVPQRIRHRFLSWRHRLSQSSLLLAVVVAGAVCRICESNSVNPLWPLTWFLAAAGSLRAISAWQLSRKTERPEWMEPVSPMTGSEHHTGKTAGRDTRIWKRLLIFMAMMQLAVFISSGFFAPFKIRVLQLDYTQFSILVMMTFVGKIISTGVAGRLVAKWGAVRLLLVGAAGIVPAASAWTLSQNFWFLMGIQLFSGLMWACYEIAMMMVFAELIPREKRLRLLAQYNVANSLAMVVGTGLGALMFAVGGSGFTAYMIIFASSSVCRLMVIVSMFPRELLHVHPRHTRRPDESVPKPDSAERPGFPAIVPVTAPIEAPVNAMVAVRSTPVRNANEDSSNTDSAAA
jgi:MFS family permease